jgi:hypothetical protein
MAVTSLGPTGCGAVLLVDGLLGDPQSAGDVLPGPALGAGVVHLEGLQDLDQAAQSRHRPQAELGVAAAGGRGQGCGLTIRRLVHVVTYLDDRGVGNPPHSCGGI